MTPNEKQLKLQVLELTLENLKLKNALKTVKLSLLDLLQVSPNNSGDSNFI